MPENPKGIYAFLDHHTKHFYEEYRHLKKPGEYAFVDYYVHEKNKKPNAPWIILSASAHGNEPDDFDSLLRVINKHIDELPNFILIPKASPTAFVRGSEKNRFRHNLNRSFTDKYLDPEAEAIKRIVGKHMDKHGPFKAGFMFHQDRDRRDNRWYYYHYGDMTGLPIDQLRSESTKMGMPPYSGEDDQKDRFLGYYANDGVIDAHIKDDGSLEEYLMKKGTPNSYVIESPMNLPPEKKDILTELFFQNIIFPTIVKSAI